MSINVPNHLYVYKLSTVSPDMSRSEQLNNDHFCHGRPRRLTFPIARFCKFHVIASKFSVNQIVQNPGTSFFRVLRCSMPLHGCRMTRVEQSRRSIKMQVAHPFFDSRRLALRRRSGSFAGFLRLFIALTRFDVIANTRCNRFLMFILRFGSRARSLLIA